MRDSKNLKARIDIRKASVLGDVNLGDVIKTVIVGKVVEMRGENSYYMESIGGGGKDGKKSTIPGELVLEIANFEVDPQGEFDDPGEAT